jgi:hypothetical protein
VSAKKEAPATVAPSPKTVLVLRTADAKLQSHGGFQWPSIGAVECSDWNNRPVCGGGLHGWLWGAGDWSLKAKGDGIKWLVVEVIATSIVDLDGKVKFPRGTVIGCYDHWRDAMTQIRERLAATVVPDAAATKDKQLASATGYYGHASATGNYGHASATGYSGHASATGNYGWAIAGHAGRAKAAANGALTILWWNEKDKRYRVAVGYVGEKGIKADTWYVVEKGKFVEVKS